MRSMLFLLTLTLPAAAADPIASGIPVGKRPGPYSFLVATGAQRGQQTCYICEQADKPTVVVFARTLSEPLGQLLVQLDAEAVARKDSGLKVWMTLVSDKADLDALAKWGQKQGLKNLPIGAYEDADGPPAYKLHKDADVTVLLFVKQRVTANYALTKSDLTDAKAKAIRKTVPKLFE